MPFKTQEEYDKTINEYNETLKTIPEIWKPLKYKNIVEGYTISNHGNIKTLYGRPKKLYNSTIKTSMVTIANLRTSEGGTITVSVNRLVAITFIDIPDNLKKEGYTYENLYACHINGIGTCNATFNIKWVKYGDQLINGIHNNYIWRTCGENHPNSVLTEEIVHKICKMLENRCTIKEIKNTLKLNVTDATISSINLGKTWKSVSSQYNLQRKKVRYSEEMIHNICKDLQDGKLTPARIGRKYKVSSSLISYIKQGRIYKDIAKDYIF